VTKLRKTFTPGTVLIMLTGRFRGARAVFLKQLESGMLLVTGPYAVNGVPLRRVNQRYCIATSTKVDVSKADYSSVTDEYFAREADKKKGKKTEGAFFSSESESKGRSQEKKDGQKKMDAPVVSGLGSDVKGYLKAHFALSARDFPHEMKF